MKCLLFFLFMCSLTLFGFTSCQHPDNAKPIAINLINPELSPDQISHDLTIHFVDSSFTKASIFAKRGRVFSNENYSILDSNVKVIFYSTTGKKNGVLTANQIKIDDITKNMFASGNVLVVSDSTNSQLETDELEWNNSKRKLFSQSFVKITSPKEIITGWGFESDENLNNYKIFKVNGVISHE